MPKFQVEETVASWVTWRCVIEADSEAEASEAFKNGDRGKGEEGPFIGDSIGDEPELEIKLLPETAA
jgi:hypothetical protein